LDFKDTAGQEEYSALRDQYMKTGQGFVLAYSITSPATFDMVQKLRVSILRIKEDVSSQEDIPIILVANKCDLEKERAVTQDEGRGLANKFGIPFLETSAKTNQNIDEVFFTLVRQINKWRDAHPDVKKKKGKCSLL